MEEYAGFERGSAEVVNVKTSVDSVSKQVNARIEFVVLLDAIMAAVARRYIAGNGTYICSMQRLIYCRKPRPAAPSKVRLERRSVLLNCGLV